jgi:hypothetical protein
MLGTVNPFPVPSGVAPEVGLLSHCTCEDVAALNTWAVGTGFDVNTNPAFVPGTNGNGLDCDTGVTYSHLNTDANINAMFVDSKFTVEYGIKYTGFTVTNGVSSGGQNYAFDISDGVFSNNVLWHRHNSGDGGTGFYFKDNSGTIIFPKLTNYSVALNDTIIWKIVHDASGIDGGSDTLRIYVNINGAGYVLKYNTITAMDFHFNTTTTSLIYSLGSSVINSSTNKLNSVVDEFKTYNYAKI